MAHIAEGVRQTLDAAVQASDGQRLLPELVTLLAEHGDRLGPARA